MTGSFDDDDAAGRQTLSTRQSSAGGVPSGAASPGKGSCMQSWPYLSAMRTPDQRGADCGAFQRSSPTGGAAKGTPLKERTLSATTPSSSPDSTLTRLAALPSARVKGVAMTAESRHRAAKFPRVM